MLVFLPLSESQARRLQEEPMQMNVLLSFLCLSPFFDSLSHFLVTPPALSVSASHSFVLYIKL